MHISHFITLSWSVWVSAAPTPVELSLNDVVLYGNRGYQMMKRDDFAALQAARNNGTIPPKPCNLDESMFHGFSSNMATDSTAFNKRFRSSTIIIPNPQSRFLGWDVLMSSVVKGAPTTISVTSGYSIANSVSVGTSTKFTLVKDFLESSLSIDYSKSWTSSQSQQFTAQVPSGKYGAFVSNPWTNRESGKVFEGVIGSEGTLTEYQADSFDNKAFGDLSWVDGVISLCVGDEVPLRRCLGEGTL